MYSIAITSANGATARRLIPALVGLGYHTIGLIRRPFDTGTHETILNWTESPAARSALARADIILHLSGDANAKNKRAYREANYDTTRIVADSLEKGRPQRIIYLSYANANPTNRNYYLRYKGMSEELLRKTGKNPIIFRCPVIVDAPGVASRMDELFRAKKGKALPVIGGGRQSMHPVFRGDVVDLIIAAITRGRPGTYELSGPEEMTIDDFIRLANMSRNAEASPIQLRHIPGWLIRILSPFMPSVSPTFVDLMLRHTNSVYDPNTFREFHIKPTRITALYGR